MWKLVIPSLVIYPFVKFFYADFQDATLLDWVTYPLKKLSFYEDEALLNLDFPHSKTLFTVAKRLEELYDGSKVYIGLQIPDLDTRSRRIIDLVLVTDHEAVVVSVKDVCGGVSIGKDGNWVRVGGKTRKVEYITDPVTETQHLVAILEEYLECREVALPEGYISFKVICPNPGFSPIHSNTFPPEVITYDQWSKLKPKQTSYYGWVKGALLGGKKGMTESFSEKLNSVLSTAPILDRLEIEGNKYILGEVIEFKGEQEDRKVLRRIRRSEVSHLTIEKSFLGFVSTLQLFYYRRDYRNEGHSRSALWAGEMRVKSNAEIIFRPKDSPKLCKYKLSSIVSISLSV